MRGNAITRIVLWGLLALVSINALTAALTSDFFGNMTFLKIGSFSMGGYTYKNADSYTVGGGEISEDIDDITIDWRGGSVDVKTYDGSTVKISETGAKDEDDMLRYRVNDGKLDIRYRKSYRWVFGFIREGEKQLTVLVPSTTSLEKLEVDAVSAAVNVDASAEKLTVNEVSGKTEITGAKCVTLKVDTVSGGVDIKNCSGEKLDVNGVSGSTTADQCDFGEIDIDTVSGGTTYSGGANSVKFNSTSAAGRFNVPAYAHVDADTVSGNVTVAVTSGEPSFCLEFDTVSGDADIGFATTSKNGKYVCGSGETKYDINTVSGDAKIIDER